MNFIKIKILYLTPFESDYQLIVSWLNNSNLDQFQINWVATENEAMAEVAKTCYDLYLIDYKFSLNNGIEFYKNLVKLNYCSPALLLLTDEELQELNISIIRTEIADFLNKNKLNIISLKDSMLYCLEQEKIKNKLFLSEQNYRLLFHNNPHPMWVYDLETLAFLEVNEAAIYKYGYSREEFLSMTIADIRPSEDIQALHQAVETAKHLNYKHPDLWRHRLKDGKIIFVAISSNSIIFNDKEARLVLAYDITEKVNASEELKRSEAKFRSLIQNSHDLIILIDSAKNIIYTSPSIENILGYQLDELKGKSFLEFIEKSELKSINEVFQKLIEKSQDNILFEHSFRHKDGSWIYLSSVYSNQLADDNVESIVINSRDVTIEQKIKQERNRYSSQLRALASAVVDINYAKGINNLLQITCDKARKIIGAHQCIIVINEDPNSPISAVSFSEKYTSYHNNIKATQINRPLRISKLELEVAQDDFVEECQCHSHLLGLLAVPIINRHGDNLGLIQLSDRDEGDFTANDEAILIQLAQIAAVALENVKLLQLEQEQRLLLEKEIQERKYVEQQLIYSQKQTKTILETISNAFLSFDDNWCVSYINVRGEELLQKNKVELIGKCIWNEFPELVGSKLYQECLKSVSSNTSLAFETFINYLNKWLQVHAYPNEQGLSIYLIDITERKQIEEKMIHNALHDELTGLANRTLLLDRLDHALKRYQRVSDEMFAVLVLDLDRFKVINDSLGHLIGDRLLQEMSQRLARCIRSGDTIARLGGDEFVILLEEIKTVAQVRSFAQRLQQSIMQPFYLDGHEVITTGSIGIALSNHQYHNSSDLLRDADTAMYQAKRHGLGSFIIFNPEMYQQALKRLTLERELRKAIQQKEFRVYYQPIISLANLKITGFEALIRWQHPSRGLLTPGEFLPVAEETGLIVELDWWILREACSQIIVWQESFGVEFILTMSVNVSNQQFAQPEFVENIKNTLQETGINPNSLKLEITETVIMKNNEQATIEQLKKLNVQLNIDDFGTGYSSLGRLNSFPIDALKIDRSFVSQIGNNKENELIINAIVGLANSLNIEVIAEGIETQQQLDYLKNLGCQFAQGYFFSRPIPPCQVQELLSEQYS